MGIGQKEVYNNQNIMGNIKIVKGVFETKLELEHAEVAAGFPINIDYSRDLLELLPHNLKQKGIL